MTVVSIGIDLEHVERFAGMGRAAWSAFYERVFTPAEQSEFGNSALSLALCFSAKEAVSKVLGTGLHINQSDEVCCKDIEINCDCGLLLYLGKWSAFRYKTKVEKGSIKDDCKCNTASSQ